ncbi:MAG TPA: hypothetical protein ENN99_04060, partial [Chloroflexi bacterium]|nr:hypothetical protein [Chloroflexota bacterium]
MEIIEGFAVETTEGLIFTVKGIIQPPDRVIAYLRYVPDPRGDRQRVGVCYRRVYQFEEQLAILQADFPSYLSGAADPVLGIPVQSVPRAAINRAYDPRQRLAEISQRDANDPLEVAARDLAELLCAASGLPVSSGSVGVTGSLLFALHTPDSDLDLVVYGDAPARAVHRALLRLLDAPDPAIPVRRLHPEEMTALHAAHRPDTPLAWEDFVRLQSRKVNEFRFRERACFVRFVKRPEEAGERYGERRYEPVGAATVRARVTDDRDAIFTPCRYVVAEAMLEDGAPVADLREIVSFRGRFSDQARAGEWVVGRGSLERVTSQRGAPYSRLVIGGQAGDYLRCKCVAPRQKLVALQEILSGMGRVLVAYSGGVDSAYLLWAALDVLGSARVL